MGSRLLRCSAKRGINLLFLHLLILSVAHALPLSFAQRSPESPGAVDPYANMKFGPLIAIIIVMLISALFFMGFFYIYIRYCSDSNNSVDCPGVTASSSSCPSRNDKKVYDVFLSFRGEDTRDNFTSHLHHALSLKSIKTFIDDQLIRGDNISQSLLDTIEASSISIIIFSERYASSRWCLDELLKILNCMHSHGQIVMPVFYRVDPSHVRKQSHSFGRYFSRLRKRFPEKIKRWKNALTAAANLSGFDSNVIRPESKLIKDIANDVLKRLDATFQSKNKGLVGVECPIEEIESLLCIGSEGVCKLGIWGIGGIGKTTIARAVLNKISRHFEGSYFALNVREAEETGGIKDLQKKLLSELLNDGNMRNIESQLNRLAHKKVLIVFDDVSHRRQIESLIGCLDELASGSRVIITTRDKQVLKNCWASQIYRMKELVYADAHKLFCQCAFGGDHLDASHTELTDKAIKYAQGVPLALKVLGCYLCGRSKEEWESAMRKLEIIPHVEIQEVLKISYDSLDDSQKSVFLDIACFLEGAHRDKVISFFDASGFQAKIELSVLEGKSLINLDLSDRIRMHDLLRDMGREIVRKESINHPGKRSRLWHHKDIYEVLKKNTGTKAIEGISLDMNKVNREIHMNSYAFSKMPKLRFLRFYGFINKCMVSHLDGVLFAELRHLEWPHYPLKTLNIHAENLVSLKMPFSKVEQLWDDVQDLVNLKEINLSFSESLTKLPNLSQAKNLEILTLNKCLSLMEIHSSIQYLNKLEVLALYRCESLTSLPTSIHWKYLKRLDLWGCSNLKNFPEITSYNGFCLQLGKVGIKELPSSIECLSNIKMIVIEDCSELESISSSIFKMKSLDYIEISNCSNFKRFLEIPFCNVDEDTGIEQLHSCRLVLKECSSLESLPSSLCMSNSLIDLAIIDCQNFKRLPNELRNLKSLGVKGTAIREVPESLVQRTTIREVPESIGQSPLFFSLDLKNCSQLDYISSSIFKLKSVGFITISNCSNLKRFLEIPSCNIDGGTGIEQLHSYGLLLKECSSLESLPSSLCMFKNLTSLEIIDCQNFKRLPNELGNSKCLTELEIKGTAIREVPESLGQLSSLKSLVLSNNNLERLPESLNQLSSLKYLQLFENSLEGIPEYLRSLPSKLTLLKLSVDLRNCLKLDSNELIEIVKDGWMKPSFDGNIGIAKSMYFPGNEIPKWFKYQSMGSSITLKTPPTDFLNNKILVGFAFCAIVAFIPASEGFVHQRVKHDWERCVYKVFCDWKRKSERNLNRRSLGRISYVESDHVFLGSYLLGYEDLSKRDDWVSFDEVSFDISTIYGEDCEVKQCGIHFVYAQDSTESREEEKEEEEPHTKRLKCSSTPKQLVLFGTKINL